MGKLGDPYQELVAEIAGHLYPGATVEVGEWLEGPDGDRDIDVSVRGMTDAGETLLAIECKDWKRRVGIEVVDALESKRRDLGATSAIICSNSGFTRGALQKAARVGLGAVSALAHGDPRVRCALTRFLVSDVRRVREFQLTIFPQDPQTSDIPEAFDYSMISFDGAPLANWLSDQTLSLLQQTEEAVEFTGEYVFDGPRVFDVHGRQVALIGLIMRGRVEIVWQGQTVNVALTKGTFDHILRRVTLPPNQGYILDCIDQEAWMPIENAPSGAELQPGEFSFDLTALQPVPQVDGAPTPPLDSFIAERRLLAAPIVA